MKVLSDDEIISVIPLSVIPLPKSISALAYVFLAVSAFCIITSCVRLYVLPQAVITYRRKVMRIRQAGFLVMKLNI